MAWPGLTYISDMLAVNVGYQQAIEVCARQEERATQVRVRGGKGGMKRMRREESRRVGLAGKEMIALGESSRRRGRATGCELHTTHYTLLADTTQRAPWQYT